MKLLLIIIPILFTGCGRDGQWVDTECKDGVVINYWYDYSDLREKASSKNTDSMSLKHSWVAKDKNTGDLIHCKEVPN